MMKKLLSVVLALTLMFGTAAVAAAAEPADAPETIAEESVLEEIVVSEEEAGFNTEIAPEEPADGKTVNAADVIAGVLQPVAGARSAQSVNAPQVDGEASFFQKIINFFKKVWAWIKDLFGGGSGGDDPYVIDSEEKLKEAAAQGGEWTLKKNITVNSYVEVSNAQKSLKIDGKGYEIKRENGEIDGPTENIFVVDHDNTLSIRDIKLTSTKGQCIRVRTSAKLYINYYSILSSEGDGIENYGYTEIAESSSITAKTNGSAAIWNRTITDEGKIGEVVLYWCNISYILNEGKLTLKQDNSSVTQLTVTAGSKTQMENGHIGTLRAPDGWSQVTLNKIGGTIDNYDPPADDYYTKMNAFKNDARWKDGTEWGYYQSPKLSGWSSIGCCAYAADFVKYVFNKGSQKSGTKFTNPSEIRAGDVLYLESEHWAVVLERDGNKLHTAEGNWNAKVRITWDYYAVNGSNTAISAGKTFVYGYHYR